MQRAQRLAALGRLAGGLAHEIRNPLAITRAAAQMLQRDSGEAPVLGEYTQVIQSIVQEHSGTIAVHSELGKGTTFEVQLPVAAPQASPQTREAPSVHADVVDTRHSSSAW